MTSCGGPRRFAFFRTNHFEKVRKLMREERYEFGDVIVREGDEADAYYVLTFGRVRVLKTRENGEEVALATLRPGDEFGEAALLGGRNAAGHRALQHGRGSAAARTVRTSSSCSRSIRK